MKFGEGCGQAFIIHGKTAKTSCPSKGALDNPTSGKQDKSSFCFGKFDDNEIDSVLGRMGARLLARIALIGESYFHIVSGRELDLFCQIGNLSALLLVGCSNFQSQKMTEGVDRCMDLRSLFALIPVVSSPFSTLGSGLESSTVKNDRRRVGIALVNQESNELA